jgi:putative PIN family toxin of toxin-antitoxin system
MRLVLDTNIVIAAVLGSGAPMHLIELAAEGELDLFTSGPLLAELAEVLERSHIARALERKRRSAPEVLALYETLAEPIAPAQISPVVLADPDDDAVLACALAAQVDLVVSGDSRLRNLKTYHTIPIVSAAEALKRVR